jgi:hypothetical protein
MADKRCPWAIRGGVLLHTRCSKDAEPAHDRHEGPGLAEFPYQRWDWLAGDRREYLTDIDEPFAWEAGQPADLEGAFCAAQQRDDDDWLTCTLSPRHAPTPHRWFGQVQ